MKLPPLNALRVFLVAAEQHSFTKAGETLHLTQGAVSRHIQTLEAHYGLPLFVRQARGLALTPEGAALFPAVRDAFARIEAASDAILYPSTSLHRVEPVTAGARLASFMWTQSMVRSDTRRAMLFDIDMAILQLRQKLGDSEEVMSLTATYHNLLREWAEA